VQLNTWPRTTKSLFALREFELTDSAGEQLGGGSSAWVVLDANTKKPQRLEKLLSGLRTGPEQLAVGSEPSKIEACTCPTVLTTNARYSDIDLNGHVNSGRYIGWLLDSYAFEFHKTHQAHQIEVNYLSETRGGEEISIRAVELSPATWFHTIVKTDGAEVCRARLFWTACPDRSGG
jgi:acyl-ACP thioesterase